VPFWAYTDAQLYQRELERIFYGPHWSYVGLEVEIPKVGDYRLSSIGERQVILVRDRVAPKDRGTDHGIRVVENRCAHRGVRFCQQPHGNARSFVCPYHQWTYKLNGDLAGPAVQGRREGGRGRRRRVRAGRHAARLRPAGQWADQAARRGAARPGVRHLRAKSAERCATTWARPSCRGWTASSRAASSRCWATTASASRATGS
jgi:nitrite reductase/ring-hydroxylating ferredoxin subunit